MARATSKAALALLFCILLSSCGDNGPGDADLGDTEPPTILSTSPVDGATDVGLIERVEIIFSEAIDATTIDATTIVVDARGLYGYVEYDAGAHMATFTPDSLYAAESGYRVVVSDEIADGSGNALAAPETVSFQTGTFDCEHLMDYLEPNDDVGEAAGIECGKTYPSLTICSDNQDVFQFAVEETAKTRACLSIKRGGEPGLDTWLVELRFLRSDGASYRGKWYTAHTGTVHSFEYSFLPGSYYLNIWRSGTPEPELILYDLNLEAGEPCRDDAYEDNDFRDEAAPITPGPLEDLRACTCDKDYYSLELVSGQTLTVTLTDQEPSGPLFREFWLCDPSGQQIAYYAGEENPVTQEATAGETGTHYVYTRYFEDGVIYRLDVAVSG